MGTAIMTRRTASYTDNNKFINNANNKDAFSIIIPFPLTQLTTNNNKMCHGSKQERERGRENKRKRKHQQVKKEKEEQE